MAIKRFTKMEYKSADEVPLHKANTRHFSSKRPGVPHKGPGCEAETFAAIERVRKIAEKAGRPMGEVSLAWVLAQPGISTVLAGARTAAQVRENVKGADLALPPAILAELSAATEDVKRILGPNLHMWVDG